ncbi:hypothetical protein [Sulfuriferula sp.]|uniref:hypothetical protein n=1 Tax=Sulfuriferula sp. TaxID=2025307 RepID=UPI002731C558|nr:hypothetical protein [Sulfuriferula sp.]MDP2025610.1 hypothetical protein [Sulfuriferula sp.]
MNVNKSRNFSIEVFRDGCEIAFRFYGCTPEEVRALRENAELMQILIDEYNEEGDFVLEVERNRTLH